MGGSMQNNVVEALVSAFYQNNFSTLRFNFRGVGRSEGIYDEGRGEQEDLIAAMSCLAGKGKKKVVLAGYSFGAWITVKILNRYDNLSDVILVSPPVDFLNFDWSGSEDKIGLIVCGDRDQFCSPESLKTLVEEIHCRLEMVRGADHFYFMKENGMINVIDAYLKT
jgi:Predicted hydrolase of the alpha/beta superfamily